MPRLTKPANLTYFRSAGISWPFTRKLSLEDFLSGEFFLLRKNNNVLFYCSCLSARYLAKKFFKSWTPTYTFLDPRRCPHIQQCHYRGEYTCHCNQRQKKISPIRYSLSVSLELLRNGSENGSYMLPFCLVASHCTSWSSIRIDTCVGSGKKEKYNNEAKCFTVCLFLHITSVGSLIPLEPTLRSRPESHGEQFH